MKKIEVCFRIDIDTVKDAQVLPVILEILRLFNISATFFVTTGIDNTYKNYRHYINPLKIITNKAIQQHGLSQMLNGLIMKKHVHKAENIKYILQANHELGLHGYNHYEWMNRLESKSISEITEWIRKGVNLFENEYGFKPKSFASPGFVTSSKYLVALDEFNFDYSSDYRGSEYFYPKISGKQYNTLQLPVASKSFGELQADHLSQAQIYSKVIKQLNKATSFFIIYMHPSYEPIINKDLLLKVIEYIINQKKFEIIKMEQLVQKIKKEGYN